MAGEGKRTAGLAAVLLLAFGAAPAADRPVEEVPYDLLGTEENPNLYQRAGRSELACLARLLVDGHYARFRVDEVYNGNIDSPELEVVYRGMSWGRRVEGLSRIRFVKGERYLLFLRYHREHDKVVRPDLFELMDGNWGKVRLDGENEGLYVEAMRLLLGAASRPRMEERHAVLTALMGNPNQVAAGAAMHQVAEAGLGSFEDVPLLLGQMERGIAGLKEGALRILRKLGPTLPPSVNRASVAQAIHARVDWTGGDPVEVRAQAVKTLMALGKAALPEVGQVARDDADQAVRYEAAVWLLENEG